MMRPSRGFYSIFLFSTLTGLLFTSCVGPFDPPLVSVMRVMRPGKGWAMPDYQSVKRFDQRWTSRGWEMGAIQPQFRVVPDCPDSDFLLELHPVTPIVGEAEDLIPIAADIYRDFIGEIGPSIERQGFADVEQRLSLDLQFLEILSREPLYPVVSLIAFYRGRVLLKGLDGEGSGPKIKQTLTLAEFFDWEKEIINKRASSQTDLVEGQGEEPRI